MKNGTEKLHILVLYRVRASRTEPHNPTKNSEESQPPSPLAKTPLSNFLFINMTVTALIKAMNFFLRFPL